MSAFFSGDPLPIAPTLGSGPSPDIAAKNFVELEAFNRKLLEYLRRLGLHLSNPDVVTTPSGPAVESLVLTLSADFNISGDPETVDWDQVHRQDAPFGYDTSTGVITFLEDGFYLILVDCHIQEIEIEWQTRLYDGTTALPYGGGFVHLSGQSFTQQLCQSIPLHMHKDQTIEFQVLGVSNGQDIIALNSRLTVLKLGDFSGSGPNSPDPCDFDIWQLCP